MSKRERIIYIILSVAIFIYLAIRSNTVGIVNDEAVSFLNYMRTGNIFPFAENHHTSANNHILNSFLGWISYHTFGIDEWVIRLPNLLSFILFSWSAFQIGLRLKTGFLRWFFWISILGAHYLIEFLAYSRGYGLGIAFLATSIVFLLRSSDQNRNTNLQLYLALLMMTLGTLANLNLLISLLIAVALSLTLLFKKFNWKWLLLYSLTLFLALAFFYLYSQELKSHNELYFGQSNLKLTFYTLLYPFTSIQASSTPNWLMLNITYFVGLFVLTLALQAVRSLFPLRSFKLDGLSIFLGLFILNLIGTVLLNLIMGINYPVGRTGLHWYFLFAGFVPFAIQQMEGTFKKVVTAAALLIFTPIVIYSAASINIYRSADHFWAKEQISDEFVSVIQEQNRDTEFPLSMQASTSFYTYILAFKNFQQTNKLAICDDFLLDQPMFIADLALIDTALLPQFKTGYTEVYFDHHSQMGLYKRNTILEKQPLTDTILQQSEYSNKGFTKFMELPIPDTLKGEPLRIDYEIVTDCKIVPTPLLVTLELKDSTGNNSWYKQQRIEYHYGQTKNDTVRLSLIKDKVPQDASTLRTFLWNPHDESFIINSARVRLYKLKEP